MYCSFTCNALLARPSFPPLFYSLACSAAIARQQAVQTKTKTKRESEISSSRSQQAVRTQSLYTASNHVGVRGRAEACACAVFLSRGPGRALLQLEQLHTDPSIVFVRACTGPHSPAARLYTSFSLESDASRARTAQQLEKQLYVLASSGTSYVLFLKRS